MRFRITYSIYRFKHVNLQLILTQLKYGELPYDCLSSVYAGYKCGQHEVPTAHSKLKIQYSSSFRYSKRKSLSVSQLILSSLSLSFFSVYAGYKCSQHEVPVELYVPGGGEHQAVHHHRVPCHCRWPTGSLHLSLLIGTKYKRKLKKVFLFNWILRYSTSDYVKFYE